MSTASVVLSHRFDPNADVTLVQTRGVTQLRAEGGFQVDRRRADDTGSVTFDDGIEAGGYYIATGTRDRMPVEVRARGREVDVEEVVQPAVQPTRRHEIRPARGAPTAETHARRQEHTPTGTLQRSDTRAGVATPID
jgi:hypothetical protein